MAGVYISYPFCAQKCTFCNFASGVFPRELERRYLERLKHDLAACDWPWQPETAYLGGGTPSLIDTGELTALLSLVPGRPWSEATMEAAPGSVSPERAAAWARAGITRVSLGVQSFVEREIRWTGRKHTAATVVDDIATLAAEGITEINIDLIAGLAAQTAGSFAESLDWIARIKPAHVSVYMLEVDDDSRLGHELMAGGTRYGAAGVPSDSLTADLYELAVTRLAALGIPRYEISNFAVPGHESRHNLKYWRLEPYLGFGADAHSFDGSERRANPETPAEYAAGAAPVATPAHLDEERFFVGLRLMEGIVPREDEWQRFAAPIDRFCSLGLLERAGGRLRLSARGVLVSNEIFQEFLLS